MLDCGNSNTSKQSALFPKIRIFFSLPIAIRYIVDCYFDKEIQDPELIFASLNDTKKRVQELESRLTLILVVLLEQTKRQIEILPNRKSVPEDIARIEFDRFLEAVEYEIKKGDRGSIESMVLDIYQRSGGN